MGLAPGRAEKLMVAEQPAGVTRQQRQHIELFALQSLFDQIHLMRWSADHRYNAFRKTGNAYIEDVQNIVSVPNRRVWATHGGSLGFDDAMCIGQA